MEYILNNIWLSSLIVFVSQLVYIYLRTLNIIHTSNRDMKPALFTSVLLSFTWLISMSIGLNSLLTGAWGPVLAFLIGNAIGTYYGMKKGIKKDNENKNS